MLYIQCLKVRVEVDGIAEGVRVFVIWVYGRAGVACRGPS